MANEDDDNTGNSDTTAKDATHGNEEDLGWEWERDLESQGHGECWRSSHMEDGLDANDVRQQTGADARACRRSDVRIYEDVCDVLSEHPMVDATKVEVEVADGIVVLRGQVCTRNEIGLCFEIVEDVAGVAGQEMLLRVRPYEPIRWEDIGEDPDGVDH